MAHGMKAWVVAAALGCALVAAAALPLEPAWHRRAEVVRLPERLSADQLRSQLAEANETLRRVRRADSLLALTAGAADRPVPFVVGAPSHPSRGLDPSALAAFERRVAGELEALGAPRPEVDLGVFLVAAESGAESDRVHVVDPMRIEWYAGTRAGRPYCIVARASLRPSGLDLWSDAWSAGAAEARTDVLGACAFWARYGAPGPRIEAWLRAGGAALGAESLAYDPVPAAGPERAAVGVAWFGAHRSTRPADLRLDACALGSDDDCAALLLAGGPTVEDRLTAAIQPRLLAAGVELLGGEPSQLGPYSAAADASRRMLAGVERRFGPEAFAAFWRSDRSVEDAFTSAFDSPPAAWGRAWTDAVSGAGARTPTLPGPGESALTLAYLGVAIALAALAAARRRPG